MAKTLTRKQKGFVKDYVKTGNGTQSALKNYEIESDNPERVAAVIATENLTKPDIVKAIAEALPDDLLAKKHLELFEQKRVDYFVFPRNMKDEEIVEHVAAAGIEVITVRTSDKGKMAFYSLPDAQAVKSALDMGYKLKGSYAPEKSTSVNLNIERTITDPEAEALREEYEGKLRQKLLS